MKLFIPFNYFLIFIFLNNKKKIAKYTPKQEIGYIGYAPPSPIQLHPWLYWIYNLLMFIGYNGYVTCIYQYVSIYIYLGVYLYKIWCGMVRKPTPHTRNLRLLVSHIPGGSELFSAQSAPMVASPRTQEQIPPRVANIYWLPSPSICWLQQIASHFATASSPRVFI